MKNKTRVMAGICSAVMSFGLGTEGWAQGAPKEAPLFVTAGSANDRLDARIFPLGWSADGKFAWLTRMIEEATDEGHWSVTILDTKTNKVLQQDQFEVPDKMTDGAAKFWAAKAKKVQPILKKYGIKEQPVAMDHLPSALGRQRDLVVAAELETKKMAMEEVGVGMGVESYTLHLRLGEKNSVLTQQKFEYALPYAVSVSGCFYSPDQKFGVVVVTELMPGYEGPPNYRAFEMAGFVTGVKEFNGAIYEKTAAAGKEE